MKKKDKLKKTPVDENTLFLRKKEIIDMLKKMGVDSKDHFVFIYRPADRNKESQAICHTPYRENTINISLTPAL